MKYQVRLNILLGFFALTVPVFAQGSFAMPTDKTVLDNPQKPLRNNIFASVKNNVPASTPLDSATPKILAKKPIDAPLFNFEPPADIPTASAQEKNEAKSAVKNVIIPAKKVDIKKPDLVEKSEPKNIDSQDAKEAEPVKDEDDEKPVAKKLTTPLEAAKPEEKEIDNPKEASVLYQSKSVVDDDRATVAFNFEEASLTNLVSYIEAIHNIKFICDDVISTAPKTQSIAGHKITFRTNKKLTKKESWDLFLTFIHIAGLDVVPLVQEGFYRIVPLARANSEPIPAFIGVDVNVLPDSDMIVRYVYFVKNVDPVKVQAVIKEMKSASGKIDVFAGLKALIFTDRASSIKSLMQIVLELDRGGLPEVLSVIKLKRASAKDVKTLYETLSKSSSGATTTEKAWAPGKKESSLEYFPQNVVIVPDERTNSLILLGTAKDVARVEEFVTKHIDIAIDRNSPPVFTYRLQYTNATDIQTILNKIVSYGGPGSSSDSSLTKYGGLRDGIKYFQPMTIGADPHSNSLIINSTEQDFEALKPLIKDLDVAQKQVGLEVLMVLVSDVDVKTLGSQISGPNGLGNVAPGSNSLGPTFLQSVTAQTSGIPSGTPIVTTGGTPSTTDFSLKSSLASLLGSSVLNETGSILVTLGQPIWAIFKVLQTITSTHIISNPFIVVSNNQTAILKSGQSRQQISGQVLSSSSLKTTGFVPVEATLSINITPQITKGNIFNLAITVKNDQFAQSTDGPAISQGSGGSPINKKEVTTVASVANGETLVLGGIMTETYTSASNGVPFLENIPVFGWFFKSKSRRISRDHFLIFIAPRLLDPVSDSKDIDDYTDYKLREAQENIELIDQYDWFMSKKDPIQKSFFGTDELRSFQELKSGKNFSKRMGVDEKINHLEITKVSEPVEPAVSLSAAEKRKQTKQTLVAKNKQKKEKLNKKKPFKNNQQEESPSVIMMTDDQISRLSAQEIKNSISGSVQLGKGK